MRNPWRNPWMVANLLNNPKSRMVMVHDDCFRNDEIAGKAPRSHIFSWS
jgi:hypothetical protein